ncbi:hypothetical protein [Companilactobacillus nantensis]|uniref:Uncharacterized protein n=1 Tax=Companilactobacillus nantensis DSM 16982 TaxID=1423774 RepID=A0A0R1WE70_9LACO|nr:hypothetical protein [Companilactobacillus nantensis]KRM15813.1 hypothetical protein FD31_GL000911 [Companilactobacillus nantensis DSM 16982]GEO64598.1 hypothetical protein LNA01_17810 [Companilactobacillus nantensis]
MVKSIYDMIPVTWAIEFKDRDTAHAIYDSTMAKYDDNTFGSRTVNNDTWYIGTKLHDDEFKTKITEFLNQYDIASDQYTITKTAVGTFFNPF